MTKQLLDHWHSNQLSSNSLIIRARIHLYATHLSLMLDTLISKFVSDIEMNDKCTSAFVYKSCKMTGLLRPELIFQSLLYIPWKRKKIRLVVRDLGQNNHLFVTGADHPIKWVWKNGVVNDDKYSLWLPLKTGSMVKRTVAQEVDLLTCLKDTWFSSPCSSKQTELGLVQINIKLRGNSNHNLASWSRTVIEMVCINNLRSTPLICKLPITVLTENFKIGTSCVSHMSCESSTKNKHNPKRWLVYSERICAACSPNCIRERIRGVISCATSLCCPNQLSFTSKC